MSTKLEDYIKEHKRSFDTELPSSALWGKIDAKLNKKKENEPHKAKLWIGMAASLIIALGIGLYYIQGEKTNALSVADVNPGYARKQVKFASLIERKTDSLEVLSREDPDLYQKFSSDLKHIKTDYSQLKQQLPTSVNQKLVVSAMEKNLELQLQVVSQQLTIINQVKEYKQDNQL